MFRSEIPAPEMPPEAGPRVPAAERLSRRSLSASESANDDLHEVQLGDVLIEDNRTAMAVFGSKCYRGGAGKSVALPAASEPGSGANLLADSVRRAMTRLLAAPPDTLVTLARSFGTAGRDRLPPGPSTMATWPADV